MKVRWKSDRGAALPTVMMVMIVAFTFAAIVVNLVTSQTKIEVTYESNVKALHAAETGINEYLWYINKENATPIPLLTDIPYPASNPEYVYNIKVIEDYLEKKVIQSTGWMYGNPSVKRTVTVTFKKRSFTQFVYISDEDPADIWWTTGDKCYGPYHTNTNLSVYGTPEFFSNVSYVGSIIPQSGTDNSIYHVTPEQVPEVDWPDDNAPLADYGKQADGYYYTGLTRIMLNSNGTITVRNANISPQTQTLPLPGNGVIYVDGGASSTLFDPNAGDVYISGTLKGRLTVGAANDIFITDYNPVKDYLDSSTHTDGLTYADTTLSLEPLTGVVTPGGSGMNDMLGLQAFNNVNILTKGWFNDINTISASGDINIYSAVMAINGSFRNFNYQTNPSQNPSGKIILRGSLSQKKRGAVGHAARHHSGTLFYGYIKNYAHDPRMMYESPPYYNLPDLSGWEIDEWN